jgi:protein SCO1
MPKAVVPSAVHSRLSTITARLSPENAAGKPYIMYYGYTSCPDVCPTTLLDMSRWIKALGTDADKLNYVFVTVDPERDTPKLLHDYLSSFDRHIRGFTGTPVQIANIAKEYHIEYQKGDLESVDHGAITFLMFADGQFDTFIQYQEKDATALAKRRTLVGSVPLS